MSQTDQTTEQILDSLTGHDEMGIAGQFGRTIGDLIPEPGMYRRALIFVVKRREGLNEDDARNAALDMRMKDVLEFFAPDAIESEDDDESGKDEPVSELPAVQQSEPLRVISPASAS